MKIVVCSFCFLILVACNLKQTKDANKNVGLNTSDSIVNISSADEVDDDPNYRALFDNFSYEGIKIFAPMAYNQSDYSKDLFTIMDTIVGLFKKGDHYQLKQCWIEKVNAYENECYGGTMIEPTLNSKDNCLYLFRGLKKYNRKSILDTIPANLKIWVGEKKEFIFNGVSYQLKAEGNIISKSGNNKNEEGYYEDISNYKLYLTSENVKQCIIEMKKFNDTMTQISWIGDIDGDNKPDFIIQSPDWYEDYRVLLFLSSFAENNQLVKLVSISFDSFAC